MKYRILITAVEPNPEYAQQLKEWEAQSRYNNCNLVQGSPLAEREVKALETVLTEAEFIAARNAILGAM